MNRPEYNDTEVPYDRDIYDRLREHGLDPLLSKHMAHLFIRDPLVIFSETINQDDATSSDHFENIQSTNWQTLRFKPPPPNSSIGWRVEFRSMEVQLTDFENAAFSIFIVLLSRALLYFNLNFYIPISKVDDNMQRAQKRDAARSGKFHFRKDVFLHDRSRASSVASCSSGSPPSLNGSIPKQKKLGNCFAPPSPPVNGELKVPVQDEYEEMSMDEIINGQGENFPGLLPLVFAYLDTLDIEPGARAKIEKYLDLVKRRANGSLETSATWIRNFVRSHPQYKFDSVVSQEINYDLLVAVDEIERGVRLEPTLLPKDYTGGEKDQGSIGL